MLEINDKGQCPICKIQPLVYKRLKLYYCHRCGRNYGLEDGVMMESSEWTLDNKRKRCLYLYMSIEDAEKHGMICDCPECVKEK